MAKKTTKTDYYHSTLYNGKEMPITISIRVESVNHRINFLLVSLHDYGDAAYEHFGCDVFSNLIIEEHEQLQKLASKFQARTAKELVDRITQRFSPHNVRAYKEFALFLIKKQIDFRSWSD